MKIRPVVSKLFHAYGRTDWTNLIDAPRTCERGQKRRVWVSEYGDIKYRYHHEQQNGFTNCGGDFLHGHAGVMYLGKWCVGVKMYET
jgi:hypothetical protein